MALAFAWACSCRGATFTAGNIVVERVGGGGTLSSAATNVFVDEYTTGGTLVQTIALPGTGGSGNTPNAVTESGSASSDGLMTLSTDGQTLLVTGYTNYVGTASVAGLAGNRAVGLVKFDGTVDARTLVTTLSGNNIRSASSPDGTNIWVAGASGLPFVTNFQTSASTTIAGTNTIAVEIYGGQLYFSSQSGTNHVGTVGTGLPVTAAPFSNLPGAPNWKGNPYQFVLLDLSAGVSGLDTLYVADATVGGIVKYSLSGGSWVSNDTIRVSGAGLTARAVGNVVTIYETTGAGTSANKLYQFVDTNGWNAGLAGVTTTLVTTAAAGTGFRGIAFAPVQAGSVAAVSFSATGTVTQTEGNPPVTVNLQLSSAVTGSVAVTSIGTATQDVRFFLSQTNFTFDGVTTSQTLTITLIDDAIVEPVQVVTLALTNAVGFTIGTISNFTFTLFDNDQPTIQFDSAGAADTPENGGPVSVNVQISPAADATVQVASVGSATLDSDFTLSATQFVFTAAGATSQALTVTLIDDTIVEPTESISLNLVAPSGAGLGLPTNFTFNILDNEPAVRFTISTATVNEGDGTYQLVVYKSSTNNTVTGNITLSGTALEGATNDYTLSATNFTLDGATTSATITVTINDDPYPEADEAAVFTIANVTAASPGSPSAFTLTIVDNDPPAPLSAGDIALIGRINNGTPDSYVLVALTNLTPGQLIYFTDNGWSNTMFRGAGSSGNGGEDIVKLSVVTDIPAGTIIQSTNTSSAAWMWDASSAIPGTNSNFNTISLSQSGDQVYVFTAPRNAPLQNPTTHLFVLDDTDGFEPGSNTQTGDIPPGLSSNANTALSFNFASSGFAALNMNNAALQSFTKEQWLAYIGDVTNWITAASATNQLPSGSLTVVDPSAPAVAIVGVSGDLAFGNVTTGTNATGSLTITNSGDAALTVTNIDYPDGFSGAWTGTIDAGSATDVTVTFAPTAPTNYGGIITVFSDATSGTNTIACSGTGIAPATGYDLWVAQITNGLTNYSDSATGDGYPNLLKYATGSSPTNSDTLAALDCLWTNDLFYLTLNRNTNAIDTTLIVEGSYALTNDAAWNGIATNAEGVWSGPATVSEVGSGNPVSVTVQDTDPAATNRFLRLRVTRP